MSHRRSNRQYDNASYIPKAQQKFIPKHSNQSPTSDSTPFPVSFSSSLRQSDSSTTATSRVSSPPPGGISRVKTGGQGQWIPSKSPAQGGGSFVNYLLPDDVVVAGLGPEEWWFRSCGVSGSS
ncbi:unnamed protein product [Cochlearia groenlandica]